MTDHITTVQWNIGGAKVRDRGSNASIAASYTINDLWHIITTLKNINPDIITLQETHINNDQDQIEAIATALGLPYWVSDPYANSHIEDGQQLAQGIISRFPVSDHSFQLFYNPDYGATWEDGTNAVSHDKGVTSCRIEFKKTQIAVRTLHLIPFKRFNINVPSREAAAVIEDVQLKLRSNYGRLLLQGDFNINRTRLHDILPGLFSVGTHEVPQSTATRTNGRRLDHVIYRGLELTSSHVVDSVLTDHYPVISTFRLTPFPKYPC